MIPSGRLEASKRKGAVLPIVRTLHELCEQQGCRIFGWVLMPEHFHLILWPSGHAHPSQIVQSLKERTATFAHVHLRSNAARPWCAKMLEKFALPPSVHRSGTHRVWQRQFYDLNIWTQKKQMEKIHDMHSNPVKRGLVVSPDLWPWSSFRFDYLEDASRLKMDSLP